MSSTPLCVVPDAQSSFHPTKGHLLRSPVTQSLGCGAWLVCVGRMGEKEGEPARQARDWEERDQNRKGKEEEREGGADK